MQPQEVPREDKGGPQDREGIPGSTLWSVVSVIQKLLRAEGQVPGCPLLPLVTELSQVGLWAAELMSFCSCPRL